MSGNIINQLLGIQYPLIQAGMIWCSPWELASSVSNAGGLGIIGSGSMYPDVLRTHIQKCKKATSKPFAVNVPLFYPDIDKHIAIIIEEQVPIVFTSGGNPELKTGWLKENGCKVVHVVSSAKFAVKAEAAGVDAVVAEGFEAGGHNGRDETTTFCLVPLVRDAVSLPLLAAGGIGDGRGMLAAMSLGADGVQIGSRFVASEESSAHINFKNSVTSTSEGDTVLTMQQLVPVRLIRNTFYQKIQEAEHRGASKDELAGILGKARAKKGMFEGDLDQGELEIGQVSALIREIKPAASIVEDIIKEFRQAKSELASGKFQFQMP